MTAEQLRLDARPTLRDARMVLGLSGWMDGGDVSTDTIDHLAQAVRAERLGRIDPEDFYIYNIPGSMEVAAMFRPHAKIEDGLVTAYDPPSTDLWYSEAHNLVLAKGREPNLRWAQWADCLLAAAERCDVRRVYFVGSVAGLVPHTREARLSSSVSDAKLKAFLEPFGVRFSEYEGPASVVTFLTRRAADRGLEMISLVAEIPAYIQGPNPKAVESVVRRLAVMLGLETVPLDTLRQISDAFEGKLNAILEDREELGQLIHKLEEDYDAEVFDTQMGDLKRWLEAQGIRLD